MPRWVAVAHIANCPSGDIREFVVEDRIVALANREGEFFALDGVCPHQGGPLGQGDLADHVVTCPWHGWQFDVRTGCNLASPGNVQPRLPVRLDEETIWVDLDAP